MGFTLYWAMAAVALLDAGSLADGFRSGSRVNPWGPAATRARGDHPVVYTDPAMKAWDRWGRESLRDGDVVFRLGDVRVLWGFFPLSRFIARATGSRFSHAGLVAVEHGEPVVYDCAAAGIQRQPFAYWMQDNIGAFGVKRLKPERRGHIPGALVYCRRVFEAQIPFDRGFKLDDDRLYCVELVEKAFRSAGLPLSEPVQIGDWKNLGQFPLTSVAFLCRVGLPAGRPDHARPARVRAGRRPPGALGIALAGDGGRHQSPPRPRTRRARCPPGWACGATPR